MENITTKTNKIGIGTINFNLNDNAKKVVIATGIVIIVVAFFRFIIQLRKKF